MSDEDRWVGRAKPPPPPPPPVDPYWDTGTGPIVYLADGPPRRRGSGRTVILVVVGVLAAACASGAVLYLLGSALLRDALASNQPTPAVTTQPAAPVVTKTASTKRPGLRSPVRDGQFEFVVTAVSCGHKSVGKSFVKRDAQGQFCVVSLTVKNIGDEDRTFADSFQQAVDADGEEYRADTAAGVILNENAEAVLNVINPGTKVTSKIVFDVPKDTELATLKLHDSPFSTGAVITLPS